MVTIVSRHSTGFTGVKQAIPGGPLYECDIVNVIDAANMIIGTRKCQKDLRALSKDEKDLRCIIKNAVKHGRFHQSEWCELSKPDTWAACDSYKFTEITWIEAARKEMECEFYVKFCIGISNNIVITISYHTS